MGQQLKLSLLLRLCRYYRFLSYRQAHRIKALFLLVLGMAAIFLCGIHPFSVYNVVVSPEVHLIFTDAEEHEAGRLAYERNLVGFLQLKGVNCKEVLTRSSKNSLFPKSLPRKAATEASLASQNCAKFLEEYGFKRYPIPRQEEKEFPLAFIILFHKDLDQVLYLLRAIYKPHNLYCLTVDLNSGSSFLNAVRAVVSCFPNVFLAQKLEHVVYASFSRFMADIHCMKELVEHPTTWRYLINMPGQQFPLKTNLEIVQILKSYNGTNDVLGMTGKRLLSRRYRVKHHLILDKRTGKQVIAEAASPNPTPPHNFKIVKGSAYNSLSREFVEFLLQDQRAQDLIEWSRDIESPDEYVYATLHFTRMINVPGGYKGSPESVRYMTSFSAWEKETPCASMFVRWICIFSTADLPMLMSQRYLFANKFYIDHHPTALHCLDQYLFNLTVSDTVRDLAPYKKLPLLRKWH